MAPDINSLPPSPFRSPNITSTSRRLSERLTSPSSPLLSSNPQSPTLSSRDRRPSASLSSGAPPLDNTGVGTGPGPIRHPRPLTAADLHMELEKEQEAAVNRLTRELTLLRQQSASVASTASSTSTGHPEGDPTTGAGVLGIHHPISARHHRSSSSLSQRSVNTHATTATGASWLSGSTVGTTAGIAGSVASGIAPPRDASSSHPNARDQLSRQSSVTSRRSETSSPSVSSSIYQGDQVPNQYAPRHSGSVSQTQPPLAPQQTTNPGSTRSSYPHSTARYEEAAQSRAELEIVRQENEALRRRVRELERTLTSRRQSDAGLSRSQSASTNASATLVAGRGQRAEEEEESVNVGESAASLSVGRGH